MLLVDYRTGSVELVQYLKMIGVPLEITELPFGDFALLGRGASDEPIPIGVERKTIQDLVNSTMTGRFAAHQLPGLLSPGCGFKDIWLLVEGIYRPNPQTAVLEIPHGKGNWQPIQYGQKAFMYKELESLLVTLEVRGGLRVRQCRGKVETCLFLKALYLWWTDKSLEEHRSHLRFRSVEADTALLTPPSLTRLWAKELPGVGWKRSGAVAGHFESPYAMVQASAKEWTKVDGIGKTLASRIYAAIRGIKGVGHEDQLGGPGQADSAAGPDSGGSSGGSGGGGH